MKSISIVVPCYNEGKKIIANINAIKEYIEVEFNNIEYEIIVINDGSTDPKTIDIFKNIKVDKVTFVSYIKNRGKGYAIKKGIEKANKDVIIFMDADLSTDLSAIKLVSENIKDFDIVIGSRRHKNSYIKKAQPFHRQLIGTCCIYITKIMTGLSFKDTQCGFKGFKKKVAKEIVKKQKINGWAFDVEYLYIANLNNYSIKEIAVTWCDDKNSTVNPISSSLTFIKELIKIRRNRKYYKNR